MVSKQQHSENTFPGVGGLTVNLWNSTKPCQLQKQCNKKWPTLRPQKQQGFRRGSFSMGWDISNLCRKMPMKSIKWESFQLPGLFNQAPPCPSVGIWCVFSDGSGGSKRPLSPRRWQTPAQTSHLPRTTVTKPSVGEASETFSTWAMAAPGPHRKKDISCCAQDEDR